MKEKLNKSGKYLIKLTFIVLLLAFVFFLILKCVFKFESFAFSVLLGIGVSIVALSSALEKSKKQKKMCDKYMESFYLKERKKLLE